MNYDTALHKTWSAVFMPFNLIINATSAEKELVYKVLEKSGTYFYTF